MPLPGGLTTITVTGTYTNPDGSGASGNVVFTPTSTVIDASAKVIVPAAGVTAGISGGVFSVVLPCTNNAGLSPSSWAWNIVVNVNGVDGPQSSFTALLPSTLGSTVDISALTPVPGVSPASQPLVGNNNTWTGTNTFDGATVFAGAVTLPASGVTAGSYTNTNLTVGADGRITTASNGSGGGVTSFNTPTGAVTPQSGDYTAAQVSALAVANNLSDVASRQTSLNNLAGGVTSGDYLRGNGSNVLLAAIQAADLPAATTSVQGAVVLDGIASDLQPDGVAAAGVTGKAADGGHVHPLQPWQFQPESYNTKAGDGKVIADVTVNGTSTIVSATIGAEGTAAIGKYIMIHGGNGAANGPYTGTITGVSGNNVTVSGTAPSGSVSNCPAVYGTDCTAAVQSAVTAAGNYAIANQYFGEVIFGPKIYILGTGPTQTGNGSTTPTFNAQVTLPYPNANGTTRKLVIALTGTGDAGYLQYWESTTPNLAGTCLVSMTTAPSTPSGTFGFQSVIGGPSAAAGFTGGYANVKVIVKGVSVWCSIFTNQYAYDFGYVSAMRVQQSGAHIFAISGVNGGVQPYLSNITATAFTNSIGSGWRTPVNGNNDDIVMDDVSVEGYECGFRIFDHFTAGRLGAIYTDVTIVWNGALGQSGTAHGLFIHAISAEAYNGGLLTNGGACQVNINWDAEGNTPIYDVNDSGNALYGIFRYGDKVDNRAPIISNASHLKVINENLSPGHWSGAPGVPGSTSAQQNTAWRDASIVVHTGSGVTVSAISVDGTVTGLTMAQNSSLTLPLLPSGKNVVLTYAGGTPTWDWWLL